MTNCLYIAHTRFHNDHFLGIKPNKTSFNVYKAIKCNLTHALLPKIYSLYSISLSRTDCSLNEHGLRFIKILLIYCSYSPLM